jgi:hypothetical protein
MDTATVAEVMRATLLRLFGLLVALTLAPAAHAGGPSLVLGATEDAVRSPTLAQAKVQMDLLALAGFRGVRITQIWTPGDRLVSADDRTILENVAAAAKLANVTVLTSVMNAGSRTTPLTEQDQADYAAYAADVVTAVPALQTLIVGNEPNLNRYWLPQFNDDGTDAAAPAYTSLLAATYDAVKAAAPSVTVLGGAVSPRGGDVAGGIRPTHSPTVFIQDMGQALRDSGRTTSIMDGFAFHPYEDNSSVAPIDGTHPNTTTIALADYDKLVALLTEAFPGGDTMPIWYDEFGVESLIPDEKEGLYEGVEPTTTKPVDETTQATYYRQAAQIVFCQPNVRGLFLFHSVDETSLPAWQSGLYYADGTPKSSLGPVRSALDETRRGVIAHCDGLALTVKTKVVQQGNVLRLTCDLDCRWTAELYRGTKRLTRKGGYAVGATPTDLRIRVPKAVGAYRLRLTAVAPVNPGTPAQRSMRVRRG